MICGLIGALLNPRSTTTVYPPPGGAGQIVEQVTPTQVAVVVPKATTAPTAVPPPKAPPTDVPPTAVPLPATAVPVADTGMTAAEQAYILALGDQTTRFSQQLSDLSEEMTNADLASEDWILRTTVTVISMNAIIDEAQHLDAPASLGVLDASYQKAMAHFRKSTTALTQGITAAQNGQTSTATPLLTQASAELTAGSTEISTTGQLLNDFIAIHK
jgi:hypothetical protein